MNKAQYIEDGEFTPPQGELFVRPRSVASKFASLACRPSQMVEEMPDGNARVFRKCMVTNKIYEVVLKTVQLRAWIVNARRIAVQEAFPFLSADGREFLQSNTTPAEWDDVFKKRTPNA